MLLLTLVPCVVTVNGNSGYAFLESNHLLISCLQAQAELGTQKLRVSLYPFQSSDILLNSANLAQGASSAGEFLCNFCVTHRVAD
jgi:hypothetical protein